MMDNIKKHITNGIIINRGSSKIINQLQRINIMGSNKQGVTGIVKNRNNPLENVLKLINSSLLVPVC